jgi:hypothetical protein
MLGWWSSKCAIRTPPSHSGIPLLIGHWFWMNHLFLRSAINQWFESWYLILGLIFDPSANRVLAIVYRVFFVVFADEIWSTISWDPWWLKQMSQRLRHRGVVSKPSLKMVCWYATTWSSILLEKMAAGLFGRLSEPESLAGLIPILSQCFTYCILTFPGLEKGSDPSKQILWVWIGNPLAVPAAMALRHASVRVDLPCRFEQWEVGEYA